MPNWVKGVLTIEGENSEEIMKKLVHKDDFDDYIFDFNKIIKRPEELNIIKGSITDDCFYLYLASLSREDAKKVIEKYTKATRYPQFLKDRQFFKTNEELDKIVEHGLKNYVESDKHDPTSPIFKTREDMVAYGKRVIDNIEKYGFMDWYDWSCNNWGTKWNACETEYNEENPSQVSFQTAWSDVRMLIYELSKQYPKNLFIYNYAMEETGVYTGVISFTNGKVYDEAEYDDLSKEAYEQAFMVWGEHLKQYYRYDEKAGTYKYVEDSDAEM